EYLFFSQSHNTDSILEEDEEGCSEGGPQESLLVAQPGQHPPRLVLAKGKKRPWVRLARRLFIPHRFKNLQVRTKSDVLPGRIPHCPREIHLNILRGSGRVASPLALTDNKISEIPVRVILSKDLVMDNILVQIP
ncbi:hypothetical protein AAG570_004931, partial [Ranatra chinensis]